LANLLVISTLADSLTYWIFCCSWESWENCVGGC